jgi:hypothetical protein
MAAAMSVRELMQYSVLALGGLMTLIGLVSVITPHPYPEFATAGMSAVLATGLVSTVGKKG